MTDGIYLKKKVFFGYTDISAAGRYVDWYRISYHQRNSIGGVMVSMLASNPVDRGFEPCSGQTKDYKIDICCFRIILVGFE